MNRAVSVIICTRNRAESLRETLASIGRIAVPACLRTELLIVDNASTDETPNVVCSAHLPNMPVRYVLEPKKGKGYAYNTGMASALGEVFLFTDDDVRVPKNWIADMCLPILENRADAVAGGVRLPSSYNEALSGLPDSCFRPWFAESSDVSEAKPGRMIGANMAFARSVVARVPKFDPELGPGARGFFDETLFSWQLIAAGFRIAFSSTATVEHHFDQSRLTPESLLATARAMGRSHAFVFYHWDHHVSRLPSIKVARCWLKRGLIRLSSVWQQGGQLSKAAIEVERELAFHCEYLNQCSRPRKYARQGLIPLDIGNS